jgi:hypothetical protein
LSIVDGNYRVEIYIHLLDYYGSTLECIYTWTCG